MTVFKIIAIIVFAYLLGGLSIAKLLAKKRDIDVTKTKSGNPGTMNMLRTVGIVPAIMTLAFDALKCAIPALIAFYIMGGQSVYDVNANQLAETMMYLSALFCVIGHIFPVYTGFKGGKGIACGAGFAVMINPLLSLVLFIIFLFVLFKIKIGSIGTLFASLVFCTYQSIYLLCSASVIPGISLILVLALILWAHRSNIVRLINKNENKVYVKESLERDKAYYKNKKENKQNNENK